VTCERFSFPIGVAVDKDENIYVADYGNSLLSKFSREGNVVKVECRDPQIGEIRDLRCIKIINDILYICDCKNAKIQVLNTKLEYMSSFGCHGKGNAEFNCPNDIAQDRAGNLYVTDTLNDRVQVFDSKGQFLLIFCGRGASKELRYPCGICVGSDDFVYVCDNENMCVSVFKTSGEFVTSFG